MCTRLCFRGAGLVLALVSAFGILVLQDRLLAETINVSAPGTLGVDGATYVLTQNVSAPGTAFIITGRGVTFDLNGHTITYNTAASSVPVYGIQMGASTKWLNMDSTGMRLRNGSVVQGTGASQYAHAVSFKYSNPRNVEVTTLNITINGRDCLGIGDVGSGYGFNIHHLNIRSYVSAISNRHAYDGYAMRLTGMTDSAVHDNVIVGGHGGIAVVTGTNVSVYGNDISHKCLDTNGYGVMCWNPTGVQVYGNYIHTDDGCGIEVGDWYQNVSVYSNTISVRMKPKAEYGYSYTAWGMKFRTYPEKTNPGNLSVHDNRITVTANDENVYYAGGIGIYDSHPALNNRYYNNEITVVTNSANRQAAGIKVAGVESSNTGTKVSGNTITSNNNNIDLSTSDGNGQHDIQFISNTLVKGANPVSYHTIDIGYWTYATENNVFTDTRVQNGASVHDVYLNGNPGDRYSLIVKWYLDVAVTDPLGTPLAGAAVAAIGQSSTESIVGVTDIQGKARLELTQYRRYGTTYPATSNYTNYTPHIIAVSKSGYSAFSQQVTMDASKALPVVLSPDGAGSALSLQKTADKSGAAPGEVVTYTITYRNTGATSLGNVVIHDTVDASLTYVPGSTRLNGVAVTPDPHADGRIAVAVGTVGPGASGTVTFQATVK